METAVAYIRVSDPRQLEGTSLEVQQEGIERYAAARGYTIIGVFIEDGRNAKSTRRRTLTELYEFVRARKGKVQVCMFPKIDRFARNAEDFLSLQRRLKVLGVRLDSVGEHIEDTPVGRFNTLVQAGVAQLDNEIRAERSYAGMVKAVEHGRWVWPPPVGYKSVRRRGEKKKGTGTIEPDPKLSPVITELFGHVAKGRLRTLKEIVSWLASKGLSSNTSSVQRMLRRKAYIGVIEAFGGVYEAKPPFVPLVTRATFYAVQARLDDNRKHPKHNDSYNEDFPLRGTVKCGCGAFLTANWSKGRSGRYAYYRCLQCAKTNIPRRKVEEGFAAILSGLKPIEGRIPEIHRGLHSRIEQRAAAMRGRSAEIDAELSELTELSATLLVKNAKGVVPDAVAAQQFTAWERKRALLDDERRSLSNPQKELEKAVEFAARFLTGLGEHWYEAELANKKKLQNFFFPTGLEYTEIRRLRTGGYPLLERTKAALQSSNSHLVHQALESPNHELWKFFTDLYACFGEEESE